MECFRHLVNADSNRRGRIHQLFGLDVDARALSGNQNIRFCVFDAFECLVGWQFVVGRSTYIAFDLGLGLRRRWYVVGESKNLNHPTAATRHRLTVTALNAIAE